MENFFHRQTHHRVRIFHLYLTMYSVRCAECTMAFGEETYKPWPFFSDVKNSRPRRLSKARPPYVLRNTLTHTLSVATITQLRYASRALFVVR